MQSYVDSYILQKILAYCDNDQLSLLFNIFPKFVIKEIGNRIKPKITWKTQLKKIHEVRETYWDHWSFRFGHFEFEYFINHMDNYRGTFPSDKRQLIYEYTFYKDGQGPNNIISYTIITYDVAGRRNYSIFRHNNGILESDEHVDF